MFHFNTKTWRMVRASLKLALTKQKLARTRSYMNVWCHVNVSKVTKKSTPSRNRKFETSKEESSVFFAERPVSFELRLGVSTFNFQVSTFNCLSGFLDAVWRCKKKTRQRRRVKVWCDGNVSKLDQALCAVLCFCTFELLCGFNSIKHSDRCLEAKD